MAGEYAFFDKLLRDIQLGASAYSDAAGKHDRVRRCLNKHYYGVDSGSANSFLVGSYGKNTEIWPPTDVDILFELPTSVWNRYQLRVGNKQSQLLQDVRRVLLGTFSTTAICGDGQIVSVPFSTYAIEVLPAFRTNTGQYIHANANVGGSWKTTDPQREMADLTQSNIATGGKTIHLIKLAKAWKVARNVDIKSFVLELAAVQFLSQWSWNWYDGKLTNMSFYGWMLRDFFQWLGFQTNTIWLIPGVNDMVWTGDEWAAQARFAASASSRACDHHAAARSYPARQEWKSVFGDFVT